MTFMTTAWDMVSSTTISNCFLKASIRHTDGGLLAFEDPLSEVTDLLDVIKVDMSRVRPATVAADVAHFISPEEEVVEDSEEVTLEHLLEPYQPLVEPALEDQDDSELPPRIFGTQVRQALATLKLYVQQQWDPGMLSLLCEVEDESALAVQKDLSNLERHLSILQLRKTQHQTPITSYFRPREGTSQGVKGASHAKEGASHAEEGASHMEEGASHTEEGANQVGEDAVADSTGFE